MLIILVAVLLSYVNGGVLGYFVIGDDGNRLFNRFCCNRWRNYLLLNYFGWCQFADGWIGFGVLFLSTPFWFLSCRINKLLRLFFYRFRLRNEFKDSNLFLEVFADFKVVGGPF